MRRTIATLTAMAAATALASCATDEGTDPADDGAQVEDNGTGADADETTEDGAGDTAGGTADADAGTMEDPVCAEFFEGQGTPLDERAVEQYEIVSGGEDLDSVSFSEVSLLQGRIQALVEDSDGDQTALLERINAPLTEVVDAVVADDARLEEEISVPDVDTSDAEAALGEFEAACS